MASRSSPALCRAVSMSAKGLMSRPGDESKTSCAAASLAVNTATLRCGELKSSVSIFINNPSLRFADDMDFHVPDFSIFHLPSSIFQSFRPCDHRHAVRLQKLLDARAVDLLRRLESIQVEVKQLQPPAAVFVHQRERRRVDARRHAQPTRKATHQLGFTRAEI